MANKSIGMTQVRRIIQLKAEGQSKLKISKLLHLHRATLDNYLSRIEASGKSYQELLLLKDEQLVNLAYTAPVAVQSDERIEDLKKHFPYYIQELTRSGVTRRILWEEYREADPGGYSYTQFCEHFARHKKHNHATMHLTHRPGEYLQVDFAGKQLHYVDILTAEIIVCPVLVCALPYSGYTYIEALQSAGQTFMFSALNRCLEYIGGVPRNVLSDNMKQYVGKNIRFRRRSEPLPLSGKKHYHDYL